MIRTLLSTHNAWGRGALSTHRLGRILIDAECEAKANGWVQ
jgi:hypothetical protein